MKTIPISKIPNGYNNAILVTARDNFNPDLPNFKTVLLGNRLKIPVYCVPKNEKVLDLLYDEIRLLFPDCSIIEQAYPDGTAFVSIMND